MHVNGGVPVGGCWEDSPSRSPLLSGRAPHIPLEEHGTHKSKSRPSAPPAVQPEATLLTPSIAVFRQCSGPAEFSTGCKEGHRPGCHSQVGPFGSTCTLPAGGSMVQGMKPFACLCRHTVDFPLKVLHTVLALTDLSGVSEEHDVRGQMQTLQVSGRSSLQCGGSL